MTPVAAGERDALLLERLRSRPPGPTIVYVTLQQTAQRVAELLAAHGLAGAALPRGHEGRGPHGRAGLVDGLGRRRSSSRRSPSAWASTRPTSATSTTTTCPRAWRATRRRSAAPAATARRRSCELLACPDDVPVLENFAYGDTPDREALAALLDELLAGAPGDELVVAEYDLSTRFDVRPLVLKTLLTYLELEGLLRQGTPFYAGYRVRPLGEARFEDLFARFDAARARIPAARDRGRQAGPRVGDAGAGRGRRRARRGALARRLGARLPRGSGPRRAPAGRGAAALHGARRARRPPRAASTRWPRASSAASGPRSSASSACSRS